jgi:SAM-dependent methyltransferase
MPSRRSLFAALFPTALRAQSDLFGDAEAYERFMGRWSRLVARALIDFAAIPDSGKALDVGSGTGALAFSLAAAKPHLEVLGIDPSQGYIAYAKSKNPSPKRVTFEIGDAQQLRFPASAFDHSLSLLVFNFIPDALRALHEVARVTKPGGRIAAAVWDYGDGMRMLRLFWDAAVALDPAAAKRDERNMPLCRSGELAALWKKANLQNVAEQPLDITMQFNSFADFWDPFLLAQGPAGAYVKSLPLPRRDALRAELRKRMEVKSDTAPISLPARTWAVRGTAPARA